MFGIAGRPGDPGHLRQGPVLDVLAELIEEVLLPGLPFLGGCTAGRDRFDDRSACTTVVEQRIPRSRRRVLVEIEHGVVAEVAREGVGGAVSKIGREGCPGEVLVDLPGHASGLQHFRECRKYPERIVCTESIAGHRSGAMAVSAAR